MNDALFITWGKGFDKFIRMKRDVVSSLRIKVIILIIKDVLWKMILAVKLLNWSIWAE